MAPKQIDKKNKKSKTKAKRNKSSSKTTGVAPLSPKSQTVSPHVGASFLPNDPGAQASTTPNPSSAEIDPKDSTKPLPPPETFDILSPLHELLHQLLHNPSAGSTNLSANYAPTLFPNQQPLEVQQLAGEMSAIRNRIRKARAAVEALPDVERSVEEQDEEMAALRGRIERQKQMLSNIGGSNAHKDE